MPGGKGGPGEGMGNGFLRSKADKRGMDSLIAFIPELLPVSQRDSVISVVVEKGGDQGASTAGKLDHVAQYSEATLPDAD